MADFEHGPERTVFGICIHTTGDGIPARALKSGKPHLEVAREIYGGMGTVGPHYVVDPFGVTEKYCDPKLVRHHVGIEADQRRSYLDGHWENDRNRIPEGVVKWWKLRHPGIKSPSHLYPSKSPNTDYIGIELIPAGVYEKNTWAFKWGSRPGFDKQRFSVEQYLSLAELCSSIAATYDLDLDKPGVLVGHEDVDVYGRPGWDPGDKIEAFSWSLLRALERNLR